MKINLNKRVIERYSRQIILKNVGVVGQKNIFNSKVLIIGAGGLGCPIIDYLSRSGVGTIGVADYDKVTLSNIHRQSLYNSQDIGKHKVEVLKKKIKLINPYTKIKTYKKKINRNNIDSIIKNFDIFVDGSDNKAPAEVRLKAAEKYSEMWGTYWFMLANPTYGDWENTIIDFKFKLFVRGFHARMNKF